MVQGAPSRWQQVGTDGACTLLISGLVMAATLGLSWLAVLWQVTRTALRTSTNTPVHDWIVVPGKRLLGSAVSLEYAARLRRAERLYRDHPQARILVLGGHTSEGPFTEAQQGASFLRQRGIPEAAIQVDDHSLHTIQNLQNARRLTAGDSGRPLALVSSRYHLARCHVFADGMNLPHYLCAAEDAWHWRPALIWRLAVEAYFLHWYWVGRIWSTLTRNHKSLARIS